MVAPWYYNFENRVNSSRSDQRQAKTNGSDKTYLRLRCGACRVRRTAAGPVACPSR
ncbi:hypothetical protein E2C01_075029 [Portunus trituberculatus]|uniref:Uncharacterized protein n=1 Tax=Portunus trituberculatus TaxID=210409 RepID=A0A5B7IF34_PORTR|nr:hypothetical protein [Portunus trituberculatus]